MPVFSRRFVSTLVAFTIAFQSVFSHRFADASLLGVPVAPVFWAATDDAGRQKHPFPVPIDEAASLPDGRVLLVLPATAAAAAAVKEPDYAKMRKEAETHAQKDFREGSHNMWFADLIDRRVPGGFAEAYAGAAKAKRRIDELEAEVAELKKARVSEQAKRVWHGMTRGVSTATDTAIEWTKRTAWPTIMEAIRARGILK